jgi:hypothetical protein
MPRPNRRLLIGAAAVAVLVVGAFDADQAITYLADDAEISKLIGSVGGTGCGGNTGGISTAHLFARSDGYKQMLISCEELGRSPAGTGVRCTSDYHLLRSDEIGRGPFKSVSFDLTVRDGKIVQARTDFGIEEFSTQMWEPFARWVSKAYPEDAAVMYSDGGTSGARLTEESIRLWELHTRGYVEEMGR